MENNLISVILVKQDNFFLSQLEFCLKLDDQPRSS
jgi:hypothetical protein